MCLVARATWAADDGFSVMAFNVLFKGANDEESIAAIKKQASELVCLTELTPAFESAFTKELGADWPHRHFVPKAGTWGVGLASKRPLKDVKEFRVAPSRMPALEATISVHGKDVRFVCLHLTPPGMAQGKGDSFATRMAKNADVRERQAATLVARYKSTKIPVVLLGDFNEEAGGDALDALESAGWVRGCAGRPCSGTFPGPVSPWPALFIIDHVYARGAQFLDAQTIRAGGSDHYPVTATLKVE
ncbi:MAG: endonuclease/exonuclease/phosphatase family protein [Myxococcales bacterium]|nr:endonuclease/exonuclease/phosphatase family protein [Myxococcales bacterium]